MRPSLLLLQHLFALIRRQPQGPPDLCGTAHRRLQKVTDNSTEDVTATDTEAYSHFHSSQKLTAKLQPSWCKLTANTRRGMNGVHERSDRGGTPACAHRLCPSRLCPSRLCPSRLCPPMTCQHSRSRPCARALLLSRPAAELMGARARGAARVDCACHLSVFHRMSVAVASATRCCRAVSHSAKR